MIYATVDPSKQNDAEKEDIEDKKIVWKDIPYEVFELKNPTKDSKFRFKVLLYYCNTKEERDAIFRKLDRKYVTQF